MNYEAYNKDFTLRFLANELLDWLPLVDGFEQLNAVHEYGILNKGRPT